MEAVTETLLDEFKSMMYWKPLKNEEDFEDAKWIAIAFASASTDKHKERLALLVKQSRELCGHDEDLELLPVEIGGRTLYVRDCDLERARIVYRNKSHTIEMKERQKQGTIPSLEAPVDTWLEKDWKCAPWWVCKQAVPVRAAEQVLSNWPFHIEESFDSFAHVVSIVGVASIGEAYNVAAVWKSIPKKTEFSKELLKETRFKHLETLEITSLEEAEDLCELKHKHASLAIMINNYRGPEQLHILKHFCKLAFGEEDLTQHHASLAITSFCITQRGVQNLLDMGFRLTH